MESQMKFTVYGKLPGLNEYTKANRSNQYAGATMKKKAENIVIWSIKRDLPGVCIKVPVTVDFRWIEANRKRDLDNICFAKKFILDGMVKSGLIANDNWSHVTGFVDHFELGDANMVIVSIQDVEK